MEYKDSQLIENYLGGDQHALELLFDKYRNVFYSYFNRMMSNNFSDADDLFQELWIKIATSLHQCKDRDNFVYWAFRIAKNLGIDHFRKQKMKFAGNIEDVGNVVLDESGPVWESIDNEILQKHLDDFLSKANPELKEVFEMRRAGLSFKEIAELQNCSINTALSRMRYLVNGLKKGLEDYYGSL